MYIYIYIYIYMCVCVCVAVVVVVVVNLLAIIVKRKDVEQNKNMQAVRKDGTSIKRKKAN